MNKFLISSFTALSLMSGIVHADVLGLFIGGGSWKHDPSGGFNSQDPGSTNIDMKNTLGLSDESEGYAYAAFEHPIPGLPNIRLEKTALTHNGQASGVNFNGQNALSGDAVISLDSTDLVLYWRPLDNWVNLDIGLTLRKFDGEFTIGSESLALQETIPMLYLAAQFDLPFSGLSVGGDMNIISVSGNTLRDARLRVLYEFSVVGVEAGLRSTTIELDDVDNVTTSISFDGLYFGAFLHF